MDKLITERDEEAIDADLKAMVEAAQRAEARNSKPAVSPLHEVGACCTHWCMCAWVMGHCFDVMQQQQRQQRLHLLCHHGPWVHHPQRTATNSRQSVS